MIWIQDKRARHGRRRHAPPRSAVWRGTVLGAVLSLTAATGSSALAETSILDPRGERAELVSNLGWYLIIVGSAVFVIVMAILAVAVVRAIRARRREGNAPLAESGGTAPILVGAILTALIMIGTFGFTLWTLHALASPDEPTHLTVQVIGQQWWWEVRYPGHDVVTANGIHILAGEPVLFKITAQDVIHSLWVPQLGGKMDLEPGRTNEL